MKLVILITAENEHGFEIAQAWQGAGATGVTIVPTYGLYSLQEQVRKGAIELPRMMASMAAALAQVLTEIEPKGHLLLSVVDDALVDALIDAAQGVLGDMTAPNNGIVFVLPLDRAIGVVSHEQQNKKD